MGPNKLNQAAAFWGDRALWHLDHMKWLLQWGREQDAAVEAARARLAAIYAATAARLGGSR